MIASLAVGCFDGYKLSAKFSFDNFEKKKKSKRNASKLVNRITWLSFPCFKKCY